MKNTHCKHHYGCGQSPTVIKLWTELKLFQSCTKLLIWIHVLLLWHDSVFASVWFHSLIKQHGPFG